MPKTILISGASSGFGAMTARALADAGHTTYASMRDIDGHSKEAAEDAAKYAREHDVDLRTVEMDVSDQLSVDSAVAEVLGEAGRVDVVVHNAGHMVLGPAEAFTVDQLTAEFAVHSWDLARATGQSTALDSVVGEAALTWARGVLRPQMRGEAFGPEVSIDPSAPLYDRLAAFFGRDPNRL